MPEGIIIFDWDDTLLPTSWVYEMGFLRREPTPEEWSVLKKYEDCVLALLNISIQKADVHIITNAEKGWVELTGKRFMSRVLDLHLPVHSAQSMYKHIIPQPGWKALAFRHVLRGKTPPFVFSVGDSPLERHALLNNMRAMPSSWGKSIKLIAKPSISQLQTQLKIVENALPQLCLEKTHLDLMLRIK